MSKLSIRVALLAGLALAACGGGGGDDPIQRGDGGADAPSGTCNPISQTGCAAGEKCAQVNINPAGGIRVTDCVPDGDVALGDACMELAEEGQMAYDNCVAGNECVFDSCREVCSTQGGAGGVPAQGTCGQQPNGEPGVCAPFQNFHEAVPDVGLCLDRCDGLSQAEDCTNAGFACNMLFDVAPDANGTNRAVGWYGSCAQPVRNTAMCGNNEPCGGDLCECGCAETMDACNLNWCDPGFDRFGIDGTAGAANGANLTSYRQTNEEGNLRLTNSTQNGDVPVTCVQYCTPDPAALDGIGLAGGIQCPAGKQCRYLTSFELAFSLAANYDVFTQYPEGQTEIGICVVQGNWGSCEGVDGIENAEFFWNEFLFTVAGGQDALPSSPASPGVAGGADGEPDVLADQQGVTGLESFVPGCSTFADMFTGFNNQLPEPPPALTGNGSKRMGDFAKIPPKVLERARQVGLRK